MVLLVIPFRIDTEVRCVEAHPPFWPLEPARVKPKLEFGMYPQSMPTEWTHARTLRPWQSVRLDL